MKINYNEKAAVEYLTRVRQEQEQVAKMRTLALLTWAFLAFVVSIIIAICKITKS